MKAVSIILIVKDDPGALVTIEKLLTHKSKVKFEIIVVVKKTPQSQLKIKNSKIKIIPYINEKKSITIPEQRNVGIKNATFDPIVFIDASCTPSDKWLDHLYEAFEKGELIVAGYVGVGGESKKNAFGTFDKSTYLEECPTANVLISKKVFDTVGYFDETFEYGSDVDLMWRSRNKGLKIKYEPKAIVMHERGDLKSELHRSFRYGRARLQLYLKHRDRMNYFVRKDAALFFYVLFILLLPIAFLFPYYLLFLLIPIIKNSTSSPFKQTLLNLSFGWGVISKVTEIIFSK